MKRRILLLTLNILAAMLIFSLAFAFAASASLSVSGGGTYNVGDTVRVTFTVSGDKIGNGTAEITYNSGVLKYTGGSGATLPSSASGVVVANFGNGTGQSSVSVTLNFKALKSGNSSVAVNPYDIVNYNDFSQMSCSSKSVSVSVKNASPSVSSNANLASLRISAGSLSPSFSPNTTSYTVNVGNDVTTCTVSASTADSGAKWSITGSPYLSVGKNTRKIIVTAANGSTKTYTLNIYRAEASDEEEDKDKEGGGDKEKRSDEIKVNVGDKEYAVVEEFGDKEVPQSFAMSVAKIGDYEVPAFVDKNLKYTLIMLKDAETGDEKWFFYDEEKDEFLSSVSISPEEVIAYEEATQNSSSDVSNDSEKIGAEKILLIVLGATGIALLGVVIALQIKIIKSRKKDDEF